MEISSPEAIKKMVQARLGLAVLPLCSVRREITEGRLATLSVQGFHLERTSGLVFRRDAPLSRAAAAFSEALDPPS
jgi:LysR family transcriptional regulator, putative pyruvate carboxylase regulator